MMPRPLRPSEVERALGLAVAKLDRAQRNTSTVLGRLRDYSVGVTGGAGPTPKGAISDPTGAQALATDEYAAARQRYTASVQAIYDHAAVVAAIDAEVMAAPLTHEELTRRTENQRPGTLQACCNIHGCPDDAWATKAGRCEACYRSHRRNGRDRRLSGQRRVHVDPTEGRGDE